MPRFLSLMVAVPEEEEAGSMSKARMGSKERGPDG